MHSAFRDVARKADGAATNALGEIMRTKIIGLVDCDSFFASCEKVFRPDWARRPVVVLSNNDGCVVARSPEAKALDIPMGEPYFKLKGFAQARGVVVRSANYALYGDMSRRVVQSLERWTSSIDVYSIDEAFLDLSGRFQDHAGRYCGESAEDDAAPESNELLEIRRRVQEWPEGPAVGEIPSQTRRELEDLAQEITATVQRWTGIPISVGLGPTRTLAKAASRLAKDEFAATGKKHALLFSKEERLAALKRLPIGKVWGVGRRTRDAFEKSGLKTAFDLARCDPAFIRKSFTIEQERVVRELRGEMIYDATTEPTPRKSMQISRSFGEPLTTLDELEKPVSTFAARLAAKLRERKLCATGLFARLETSRFAQPESARFVGLAENFTKPTNLTPEILATALKLLRRLYAPGYEYKRAGLLGLELIDEATAESRRYLFELDPDRPAERRERDRKLSLALDAVNAQFGRNSVFFASEGVERPWSPNSSFISPSYTTDWSALPVAS